LYGLLTNPIGREVNIGDLGLHCHSNAEKAGWAARINVHLAPEAPRPSSARGYIRGPLKVVYLSKPAPLPSLEEPRHERGP